MENGPCQAARRPDFEWRIYADATFAGLSALIPLPGLDLLLELVLRRRMPRTIARRRAVHLRPEVRSGLGSTGRSLLSLHGCAALPVLLLFWLLKRISRKLLYFLTVKEAFEQVSSYWHRAYLVDYLITSGRIAGTDTDAVLAAFHRTLEEVDTGSVTHIARHAVRRLRIRVARLLGRTIDVGANQEAMLARQWTRIEEALRTTAGHFEWVYQQAQAQQVESRESRVESTESRPDSERAGAGGDSS